MIISDKTVIGNRLLQARKRMNYTQAEAAERAGLSERSYASIERGEKDMRVSTLCSICRAFGITPDMILIDENNEESVSEEFLLSKLEKCTTVEREGAFRILSVYLNEIQKLFLKQK